MAEVDKKTIEHIAKLAKLKLTEAEEERYVGEFNNILGYVSKIQECDTTGIEFEHNLADYNGQVLQEDEARPSISRDEMLKNATEGRNKNGYIRTSKIVSKE